MMERESSDSSKSTTRTHGIGTYWLRRGELKRNLSATSFSFIVTAGCILFKGITAYFGHGVWSGECARQSGAGPINYPDMSLSDIAIATLFYQFSLYICVRLARRGFTLGELALVCNAATAMFMETVNLTRVKVRRPYRAPISFTDPHPSHVIR